MNAAWLIRRSSNALRIRPRAALTLHRSRQYANLAATQRLVDDSRSHAWFVAAAAATAMALSTSISLTMCEEKEATQTQDNNHKKEEEEEERYVIGPDDPYYNIPEEDEPTDCSMCKTFRQGPCRVDWKRFELCVKDQDKKPAEEVEKEGENKEEPAKSDPTACMKYAMPFYMCSSNHVNTYLIIGNEQTQETVVKPMMDVYNAEEAQSRRLCFAKDALPPLDWVHWEKFVAALYELGGKIPTKFAYEKTGYESPAEALKATWADKDGNQYLMMDNEGEPYLLTVFAQVPKVSPAEKTDEKLFMTYALDQKGNLLGDARNQDEDHDHEHKEAIESKEGETDIRDTHVRLQVQIIPGVTESFTIYGLYVPKDGDFLEDGVLFESKAYPLDKINKKAAEKGKKKAKQKKEEEEQMKEK